VEHFKQAHRARSGQSQRAALSGDGVYVAVDSGSRVAGKRADGGNGSRRLPARARKESGRTRPALASLASIAYQQASSLPPDKKAEKLDEAAKWNKKLIEADPKNKEAYYYLGVISWAKWYPQWITARSETST